MLDVEFAKQKLRAVLAQIDQLRSSDFAYEEPTIALSLLASLYNGDLSRLDSIDASTDDALRRQVFANANANIAAYYNFLGFILRSTNVRNAFEIYDPLLLLCKKLYGSNARLILSSEWDFSPLTYPAVTRALPDLMFIGLPSTEASNALIVPLAGHEIGHSLWRKRSQGAPANQTYPQRLSAQLEQKLTNAYRNNWSEFQKTFNITRNSNDLLTDLFLRGIWYRSFKLAVRQIEELFCDLIGLRLFGEGFLYSFIYLLSPNLGERTHEYPSLAARISCQERACGIYQIPVPDNFSSYFFEPSPTLVAQDHFIVKMADQSSSDMVDELIDAVNNIIKSAGVALPSTAERDRIIQHFTSMSPATGVVSLGDIINAGWHINLFASHWKEFDFKIDIKWDILNDLVYKTMEVMEFERKVGAV